MKFVTLSLIIVSAMFLTFTSCRKDNASPKDYTAEFNEQIDEQMFISAEIDGITVDAISIAEAAPYFTPGNTSMPSVCNSTITVDSSGPFTVITVNYDGANCAQLSTRKGTVEFILKKGKWLDEKSLLVVNYNNIEVKRLRDNRSIVLSGSVDITNESGGGLYNVINNPVTHLLSGQNMQVKFSDGISRPWKISVKRVFSFNNGLVLTTTGNASAGTVGNISASGITHAGKHFTTIIEEPMIIREDCYFRLTSAKLVQLQQEVLTIRFGLNAAGDPTTCPGANPYYLKADWTSNGKQNAILMAY